MKSRVTKAWCFLLFGFISAVSASSFKCYQCTSEENPDCGDPFKPNVTLVATECQDLAYVAAIFFTNTFTEQRLQHACIKTVKTTGDKVVVTRKCSLDTSLIKDSNGKPAPNMCDEDLKQVPGETCNICMEEACNSAPRALHSVSSLLVALPAIICIFTIKAFF
ncbi:uncharacterized protein LOC132194448 [Neocloeon triangulifer]|uniref:uncharacterized protein LOC132194448 n=1 Tax=Neocloeon triangulifer TaxID=2078957 RepID=UPI00286F5147|nr:uncharacterized protein LOC132194448 [Neocloeon triangulifer]XP_059471717.1 uncharacterized protein LOC132194448 [Neocloeon triangulifer]